MYRLLTSLRKKATKTHKKVQESSRISVLEKLISTPDSDSRPHRYHTALHDSPTNDFALVDERSSERGREYGVLN